MPVIARSDPIQLQIETPSAEVPAAPAHVTATPAQAVTPSNVLERHRQFIGKIDAAPTCFVRGALPGFSDNEFTLHLGIAKIDKYLVDAGNGIYCSKAAVANLSKALERLKV